MMWQRHNKDRAHCSSGSKRTLIVWLQTWIQSHTLGNIHNELDTSTYTWEASVLIRELADLDRNVFNHINLC